MIHIPWKEKYSINFKAIDVQHKELLSILNLVIDILSGNKKEAEMESVLRRLADYAMIHFSYEEKFMKETNYPNVNEHRKQHAFFVKKVLYFNENYDSDSPQFLKEMLDFLKEWFVQHIQNSDQDYAPYLKDSP